MLIHELPQYLRPKAATADGRTEIAISHRIVWHFATENRPRGDVANDRRRRTEVDRVSYHVLARTQRLVFVLFSAKTSQSLHRPLQADQLRALTGQTVCDFRVLSVADACEFTDSSTGLLIGTSVAARVLQVPRENYINRSGRTAPGNKEAIAVLLMEPVEVKDYVKLCRSLRLSERVWRNGFRAPNKCLFGLFLPGEDLPLFEKSTDLPKTSQLQVSEHDSDHECRERRDHERCHRRV